MMRGTNAKPFTADDIQDVSERGWPHHIQCACNPGCLSCNPSCGRSGPDRPFALPVEKRRRGKPDFGPSEDQIHRAIVEHLRRRATPGVVWFHVPNGGRRNRIEAARFKGLGVQPGVADLIFVHRGSVYALELKSSTGRPTVAQMEWMSAFNAAGGYGVICHDLDKAVRCLETWGLLRSLREAVR